MMLKQKKTNFEPDNIESKFPEFSSLNKNEMLKHLSLIKSAFNCSSENSTCELFDRIIKESKFVPAMNAKDIEFSFHALLKSEKVEFKTNLYIDWHRFDDIDCIEVFKFSEFFDDIWYPEADDIYIYDNTFKWFVLISHDGAISMTRIES